MTAIMIDLEAILKARRVAAKTASQKEVAANDDRKPNPYTPAYCDPNNEFRGTKYDATRDLPLTEVCKRIRQDIKDAIAGGRLPKVKVSVRKRDYRAVTLMVTEVPDSFRLYDSEYLAWARDNPSDDKYGNGPYYDYGMPHRGQRMTAEYENVLEVLTEIAQAYNRDNSDSMTDYFDVRFYKTIEFCWKLTHRRKDEEMAALPA